MSDNIHDLREFEPSKSDLENLREWLKKMPHLVQDYDDKFLAGFVRGCKGRLQKTKEVLENFNNLGFRYRYLFGDLDPLNPRLQKYLRVETVFPVPKRLEDGSLVAMFANNFDFDDGSEYRMLEIVRYFLQWLYIYLWEDDFGPGKLVLIIDNKGLRINQFKEFTPVAMRDLIRVLQTSLPIRPKALHLINLVPSIAAVFNLLKSLSPEQFKRKIYFHSTVDSLYEHVPKENLPKEYGGFEGNVETLFDQWKNKVESYRDRLVEENLKMTRLDSIRPKLDDLDNTYETFTQLNFD